MKNIIVNYLPYSFFVLLLGIGYVPYLSAMDKMATQFLFLSIVNLIYLSFLFFFYNTFKESVKDSFNNKYLIALFLFVIISFSGYYYALNKVEVIVNSTKMLTYFLCFLLSLIFINRIKNPIKFFILIVFIGLLIDNIWITLRFIERFDPTRGNRDMGLRAFSGNINITAFVLSLKVVIVSFLLSHKNKLWRLIVLCILSWSFFNIFLMGSRGANLSILIASIFILIFSKRFFSKNFVFNYLLAVSIGVIINQSIFLQNDDYNVLTRTVKLNNASSNQRLRFFSHAFKSISENPILGVGSGNWKIESIKYDRMNMYEYTVPYHAHNDVLEIFTEVGALGGFLFFSFFVYWLIGFLKLFKHSNKHSIKKQRFLFLLFVSTIIFFIDVNLNFPTSRPVEFIFFITILVLIFKEQKLSQLKLIKHKSTINRMPSLLFLIFSFLLGIISIYPNYKNYESFVDQNFLTVAARGDFYEYDEDYVYQYDSEIPNLTATTIPIEAMKANLIINIGAQKDTLLGLIDKGRKANPYIGYPEIIKSLFYIRDKNLDSAYYYSKQAFYKIPNHQTHFNLLFDLIEYHKDTLELDRAYSYFKTPIREEFSKRYLELSNRMKTKMGPSEENVINKLFKLNPNDETIYIYKVINEVGKLEVEEAYFLGLKADEEYEKGNYLKAGELFEKASKKNPQENSHYENAANSFMKGGKIDYAIKIIEKYIPKNNPKTGKAEYLLGIMKISKKDYKGGCEALNLSKEKGFSIPDIIFQKFCNKNY